MIANKKKHDREAIVKILKDAITAEGATDASVTTAYSEAAKALGIGEVEHPIITGVYVRIIKVLMKLRAKIHEYQTKGAHSSIIDNIDK